VVAEKALVVLQAPARGRRGTQEPAELVLALAYLALLVAALPAVVRLKRVARLEQKLLPEPKQAAQLVLTLVATEQL
jgi:hypothetical protein